MTITFPGASARPCPVGPPEPAAPDPGPLSAHPQPDVATIRFPARLRHADPRSGAGDAVPERGQADERRRRLDTKPAGQSPGRPCWPVWSPPCWPWGCDGGRRPDHRYRTQGRRHPGLPTGARLPTDWEFTVATPRHPHRHCNLRPDVMASGDGSLVVEQRFDHPARFRVHWAGAQPARVFRLRRQRRPGPAECPGPPVAVECRWRSGRPEDQPLPLLSLAARPASQLIHRTGARGSLSSRQRTSRDPWRKWRCSIWSALTSATNRGSSGTAMRSRSDQRLRPPGASPLKPDPPTSGQIRRSTSALLSPTPHLPT